MAAHDTHSNGTYASGTTFTWNHTYAASAIGLVWVGYKFSAFENISGVTVGGSAATFVARVSNAGGGNRLELWKHETPTSGSQAIVVTFSGNLGSDGGSAAGISVSATGASGWSTSTSAGPTSSTTPTVTVPSVGASDVPYAAAFTGGDPTQQDTAIVEVTAGGNFLNAERQAAGGDGVLNWSEPSGDEWMVIGARAIDSGGAASGQPTIKRSGGVPFMNGTSWIPSMQMWRAGLEPA